MALTTTFPRHSFALINTLRPTQYGHYFPGDIFKCISLNENAEISINIPVLVQVMAWRLVIGADNGLVRPGDRPLSVPMMVRLPTQICVTRPR